MNASRMGALALAMAIGFGVSAAAAQDDDPFAGIPTGGPYGSATVTVVGTFSGTFDVVGFEATRGGIEAILVVRGFAVPTTGAAPFAVPDTTLRARVEVLQDFQGADCTVLVWMLGVLPLQDGGLLQVGTTITVSDSADEARQRRLACRLERFVDRGAPPQALAAQLDQLLRTYRR